MLVDGNYIADCVLAAFNRLPAKAKPRSHPDGSREWVPLAGIVVSLDGGEDVECVALGTGMRCLPSSKLSLAHGLCLHDWHAEIVAIRAFNLWLIQECSSLLDGQSKTSKYVHRRFGSEMDAGLPQPFSLKESVRIFMYCSEAPCGDASMELTMNAQEDATPWTRVLSADEKQLSGRGDFSRLGEVRRKPARADAPATLSKSCSDKLALKQCTSLLSSVTNLLVTPQTAYLHELVLPESQLLPSACMRAFSAEGRMASLSQPGTLPPTWPGGFAFKPFTVRSTTREFEFSRRQTTPNGKMTASNIAAMWTARHQEVIIGGTVQGNKQFSVRGASVISRASLASATLLLLRDLAIPGLVGIVNAKKYADVKRSGILSQRCKVKEDVTAEALHNWVRNVGDDDFTLVADSQ